MGGVTGNGAALGNRRECHSETMHNGNFGISSLPIHFVDQPNTTDMLRYYPIISHGSGGTRTIFINRVKLSNLSIGEEYYYVCGTEKYGWSSLYKFNAMRDFSYIGEYPHIIFYGDFGDTNSVSLGNIETMIETAIEMEDEKVVLNVQKGVQSRFYKNGRYSANHEQGTHYFHQLICKYLSK